MLLMRTTLTLEDDLMELVEAERRRRGETLKEAINTLIRDGLRFRKQAPRAKRFKTSAVRMGLRPGIDPDKLNQFVDELDADEHQGRG